ncbi:MAG: bifunctional phosphoribosylaminoimidazolecarboxamide formyltransferase/IMP cyclohydrolase PurH [Nitrospiraceae bacterium]|nr:MAG: bifunctional phosphoribosylaminoimidazolecarboxamide formyltransferase/IMP cyclohydrolase PurH [Nitrospiraceae bacterium]
MAKVERALISVSDKTGIAEFAKELGKLGIEIISTGGTATTLSAEKIKITEVSKYTGFPEMLGGRLKTLHPKIHGGLLWRRDNPQDEREIKANQIKSIDMVVVNLYPFEQTVSKPDVAFDEAIENIDIGGPTMLRAASKNFRDVVVIVDPADYEKIIRELKTQDGEVGYDTKFYLAQKVFTHTARYDTLISNYLARYAKTEGAFPQYFTQSFRKVADLRYGENPHQRAAIYKEPLYNGLSLVDARILQGKEMSYNNYLDSGSALDLVREFKDQPAAVIIKHNNPCGVATADRIEEAYVKAYEIDPLSAFGGVIALNRDVNSATAKEILKLFVEIIIAPGFDPEALALLSAKPNIRLLALDIAQAPSGFEIRKIQGGLLVQERDTGMITDINSLKVATKRKPTDDEYAALSFAWKVCKHMKSNAIIYTTRDRAVGIGVGQTSRVDSAKLGAMKALNSLKGSVVGSDAFFPNRDGIDYISSVGVTAVIQPGGSIKDNDVIAAADEHNMAMVFTGMRHFKH